MRPAAQVTDDVGMNVGENVGAGVVGLAEGCRAWVGVVVGLCGNTGPAVGSKSEGGPAGASVVAVVPANCRVSSRDVHIRTPKVNPSRAVGG